MTLSELNNSFDKTMLRGETEAAFFTLRRFPLLKFWYIIMTNRGFKVYPILENGGLDMPRYIYNDPEVKIHYKKQNEQ